MSLQTLPKSAPPPPDAAPSPMAAAVLTLDGHGRVQDIPSTTARLLTRAPEDCRGCTLDEVFPDPVGDRIRKAMRQTRGNGAAAVTVYHPAAQRWFDVLVRSAGETIRVTFRDRTAHEQCMSLLHLLDTTVLDGHWRASGDGTIETANVPFARFLGYDDASDLEGRDVARFIDDSEGHPDWTTLRTAAEQGTVEHVVCSFRRRDGQCVRVRLHLTAVHDHDGRVTAFNGRVVRDEPGWGPGPRRGLLDRAVEATEDAIAIAKAEPGGASAPRIVYVNDAFTALTGYPAEDVLGNTARLLYGPGTDRDVLVRLQAHLEAGRPVRGETVLYRRDGTPYVSQWSAAPVYDESGALTHWVSVQRDVTEERNARAALRERGQRTEALYAALTSLLEAETTREVAAEAASLVVDPLGLAGAVVRHADAGTLSPLATAGAPTAVGTVEIESDHPAARAFQSDGLVAADARLHLPLGDYGVLTVEDEEGGNALPIRPLEALAAHTTRMLDRLARAAAQRRAHERSEALREAGRALLGAGSVPAGTEAAFDALAPLLPPNTRLRLFSFDPNGETARVRAANDHPLSGLARGTAWPVDAGLQRFREHEGLHAVNDLRAGSPSALEQRLLAAGCRSYVAAPLPSDGTVQGVFLLAADVPNAFTTAHRTLAEEAADLLETALSPLAPEAPPEPSPDADGPSSLKSAFLANVHHELRTPLTSIIGFAEVLSGDAGEAQKQFADLIARSGRRLKDTFDALLTLSRLEAGTMVLDPSPLSVTAEVRTAVEAVQEQARAADLSLDWNGPDAALNARIDHDGLHGVLQNLLDNAIKFSEEGDTVTVRLRRDGDAVVLTVADTGLGMAPERVPELFVPFRQASTGLDRTHEGCGVGLALVQGWVDAMGGTVDVETTEGEGTTVTVRLPKAPPTPPGR